jgi:endo-1,4-beta-xylanase
VESATPESVRLGFDLHDGAGSRTLTVAQAAGTNGTWLFLSGTFRLQTTGNVATLDLCLDGPAPGVSFRLDDVVVIPLSGMRLASRNAAVWVGGVLGDSQLRNDAPFTRAVGTDYHIAGPENALKFSGTETRSNVFSFSAADTIVSNAMARGQQARGHTLVWHGSVPSWLSTNTWTTSQLQQIVFNHIDTVVGRYKDRVFCWDVVNEAFNDNGTMRSTIFYDQPGIGFAGQGTKYIEEVCKRTRAVDPDCLIIYNDYGAETDNAKSDAIYAMAQDFLARGVPLDGIGFQFHLSGTPSLSSMRANFQRFNALGLALHITELDVRVPVDSNGVASAASLASQGDTYFNVVGTALAFPRTTVIQTWGFSDRYSWIPGFAPGYGAALPLDQDFNRKPAWWGLFNALANQAETLEVAAVSAGDALTLLTNTSFSAGRARRLAANATNDFLTLVASVPYTGEYNLRVGVRKSSAAGTFRLAAEPVAGGAWTNLGSAQDLYAASTSYNELNLGSANFAASGDYFFRFTVTGRNASSTGHELVIDYLRLTPTGADGNQPPAISPLADQTIYEGQGTGPLPVTLSDRETVESALTITASASNPALVPGANLVLSGGGPQRLLVVTPAAGQSGTSLVNLTVTDAASNTVSESFTLTVLPLTTTLIAAGSVWKYFDKTNDLGTAWRSNTFSDATWSNGLARLGYGNDGEVTKVASNRQWTTYFRRQFYVPNPVDVTALSARLTRDDGAVVYLNGTEIWRDSNLPGGVITNQTPASIALGRPDETNWFALSLPAWTPGLLVPGWNLLAAEVHNQSLSSSDLGFDFKLTANALLAGLPALHLANSPGGLTLSWPADASYFTVTSATNLTPPVVWTPLTNTPVLLSNQWRVTLPAATNGQRFFRLQTP